MLNDSELQCTSEEPKNNLALSELTPAEIDADLIFTPERIRFALEMNGADPMDVWLTAKGPAAPVHDVSTPPPPRPRRPGPSGEPRYELLVLTSRGRL
jgi:hypothetical protein